MHQDIPEAQIELCLDHYFSPRNPHFADAQVWATLKLGEENRAWAVEISDWQSRGIFGIFDVTSDEVTPALRRFAELVIEYIKSQEQKGS